MSCFIIAPCCFAFSESSGLSKNDGDKKPEGMRRIVIGRLRRRVPESPAMDAAKTRHEDNFGIPLDALDETPPFGIESLTEQDTSAEAHISRAARLTTKHVAQIQVGPAGGEGGG